MATTPTLAINASARSLSSSSDAPVAADSASLDAEQSLAHRDRASVDDANRDTWGDGLGSERRGLVGRRESRRNREHEHAVASVGLRLLVGRLKRTGRRRGGLGQRLGGFALGPKGGRREVDAIDELFVAEADRERHDVDLETTDDVLW